MPKPLVDLTDVANLPVVLTVEEAGAVLRIGRSQAYALARRFIDSGGLDGIPVVRFGSSMRVPTASLLKLLQPHDELSLGRDRDGAS
ncbi:MAG: helix-turn-helix domain-containing protein [Acidimicrobiia bacterium]